MYQLRTPAPALREFIEHYWFVTQAPGESVTLRVEVFVDGRADLIFNFGAPYLREVIGGAPVEQRASNLDAQRLVPIRITQSGAVRTSGVRFRLGGLGPFVRAPLGMWTGTTPPPVDVFGEEADPLEGALASAGDLDAQAPLLDAFFGERLNVDAPFPTFQRALSRLAERDGPTLVAEVAAGVGVSSRQLDRLFSRYLGVPPKTVAGIARFQRALRALERDPQGSLADVGAAAGYFDHAHFIRDFKRMSGGVPRGFRGYYPPAGPADFAPNVVVFVQDLPPRER